MKFYKVAALASFSVIHLYAIVEQTIDTTKPMKCVLSRTHQNRIMIKNGIVKKLIYPAGTFSVRMEEESGQAFLTAQSYTA